MAVATYNKRIQHTREGAQTGNGDRADVAEQRAEVASAPSAPRTEDELDPSTLCCSLFDLIWLARKSVSDCSTVYSLVSQSLPGASRR